MRFFSETKAIAMQHICNITKKIWLVD